MKKLISLILVLLSVPSTGVTKADFTFGTPTNLGATVNSEYNETFCFISDDGLQLCFSSDRPGGYGAYDLWVTSRVTKEGDWGIPVNLGIPVNSSADDGPGFAAISADELELYISSSRPGGSGLLDIWVTKRESKDDDWEQPVNLGPTVNSSFYDYGMFISADGLELYFNSMRSGGLGNHDLYVIKRATINDEWGAPINLGSAVNGPSHEIAPHLLTNGLYLFFSDHPFWYLRAGGFGGADIWVTKRATISEPWGIPVNIGPTINSSYQEAGPYISADGMTLYFSSNRPDGYGGQYGDIWQAPIIPIVDLNGDEIVNAADMCIVVDHWGENYTLCDIGPTPFGDGVVNIQDLIVLAEHLFEDYRLVAHWALDEEMGNIAYDCAGEYDGNLQGEPLWQPTEGKIDGALQFDGIDDCVTTGSPLNPADGDFSVFVWVKCDTPGQVILSQIDAANWLFTDSAEGYQGYLKTSLKCLGRSVPLLSQTCITDNNWHRIGLVWDGSYRCLYVDGVEVANDAAPWPGLASADSGLFFGTGCHREHFFSGLIDDIRIYNVALTTDEITDLSR
jgi:hypothetical protein